MDVPAVHFSLPSTPLHGHFPPISSLPLYLLIMLLCNSPPLNQKKAQSRVVLVWCSLLHQISPSPLENLFDLSVLLLVSVGRLKCLYMYMFVIFSANFLSVPSEQRITEGRLAGITGQVHLQYNVPACTYTMYMLYMYIVCVWISLRGTIFVHVSHLFSVTPDKDTSVYPGAHN